MNTLRTIVPSFVVQEEGARKVLVYLNIPDLKVKRTFPNLLKFVPSNGHEKTVKFEDQSFTFTIDVQNKLYSLAVARLPGDIQPERCSIKYTRGGCWITLIKVDPMPWMNRICDDLRPGLETQEDEEEDDPTPTPSAPAEEVQLKDSDMPPPFNLVPLAPPVPRPTSKKAPAPPPPPPRFSLPTN